MGHKSHTILLTFDLEEFDLPVEHGINIASCQQMELGKKGLDHISDIMDATGVNGTLFTTANFALKYPARVADLAATHEIASHTFFHSSFHREDLLNSRQVLQDIISKPVYGVRLPRMKKIEVGWIREAGYTYDASVTPSWIPGPNRNFRSPRSCYSENGVMRVPASVSANFRIPLFWLAFKNLPYSYFKRLAVQALKKDGYLSLYFHPWEFLDLGAYDLPFTIKRKSGPAMIGKVKRLIEDLKNEGEFSTINNYLQNGSTVEVNPLFKYQMAAAF